MHFGMSNQYQRKLDGQDFDTMGDCPPGAVVVIMCGNRRVTQR